ncbi:MAG: nitroreductase family protein [Nitriliruptorales bacterium]
MELYEVMRTSASIRVFTDEPVADEVVHRILDHARFAPSGGNRQGWRVVKVDDPGLRAEVARLYELGWREYVAHREQGLVPFAPTDAGRWTGPAVDLDAARATPRPNAFTDGLPEVPVLLVVCVELAALAVTDNGLDRQSIVGGASIYPFCHNLLLAARNEGLGGVMTTTLCREEPQAKELLGIPEGFAIASLIALGHPTERVSRLTRDPVDAFTTVNRFDGTPFTL